MLIFMAVTVVFGVQGSEFSHRVYHSCLQAVSEPSCAGRSRRHVHAPSTAVSANIPAKAPADATEPGAGGIFAESEARQPLEVGHRLGLAEVNLWRVKVRHGFLEGVHISHPVQGGVVRGVSDLLSGKANADKSGSQQRAADAARS